MLDTEADFACILCDMNRLTAETRVQILEVLAEGSGLRATSRLADVSINTVRKLLVDLGASCAEYHYGNVHNLRVRRLQCGEVWSFAETKNKNAQGWGDIWTWVGLDADTKLCVSYLVGGRDGWWARELMNDCARRIRGPVQMTTEGHKVYLDAVKEGFGADIDYAQLQKIYGVVRRYSPAESIGCEMKTVSGRPDPKYVGTSFVERQNLAIRMGTRRFTRLTNGFSKKAETHAAIVAIHFLYYNFAKIHQTLRVTPAMAAGISDHVWSLEEIVLLAN